MAATRNGPLAPTTDAAGALRPADRARITGGMWHTRRTTNATASIPDGFSRLEQAGNLANLRLAAGQGSGSYAGDYPFLDSDLYKWLEAASWQLADEATDPAVAGRLAEQIDQAVELLAKAQEPSGYLQSYFQVVRPQDRFTDLRWGHEMYCAGHLIQAAVANKRATGQTGLLAVATRLADHIDDTFGPGGTDGICGHPEIETALVELYRETGEARYLRLAGHLTDRRGHGLLSPDRFGSRYWQDHVPVRQADTVAGHAVRQVYLLAGVIDLYAETGDRELLDAAERLWTDMAATRTYLTGGIGAHHTGEEFGDPYELPPERAYTETCAAIGSIQAGWRLLLATGRARYAELIERTLYNGFLAGVSLDGLEFLYINPLQVRAGYSAPGSDQGAHRTPWFRCACCPPNVMRLLASLPHYAAAGDGEGLVLHQYMTGEYAAGPLAVRVDTAYPWFGTVRITVTEAPDTPARLTLRIPEWTRDPSVSVDGEVEDGWWRSRRVWRPGDEIGLDLDVRPRLTAAHPRVDAVRGCVALERGPLVYCLEEADQQGNLPDDLLLDPAAQLTETFHMDLLGGLPVIEARGAVRTSADDAAWWPYRTPSDAPATRPATLRAIPYHAWANRAPGAMRVWIPTL